MERFDLLETLGSGGNGTVHRARDAALEIEVAIKILARTEGLDVFRFKREFRAFSEVLHPNLVRFYELFADGAQWFFSMELVRGAPFDRHVRPGGALDPARLRDALYQTADALCAIHRLGKVHRDIKPSNILVEPGGRVVVLDYGLVTDVHAAAPQRTHQAAVVGTPAYVSPEQALDEPLGPPSDWYSLGIVLYEALTGALPFEGSLLAQLHRRIDEEPPPPRTRAPDVAPDLEALCLALLRRVPGDRAGAREVFEVLRRGPSPATLAVEHGAAAQPFVGRQRELDVLRDAFDEARRGRNVVVLVTGPSGIGKTTLIHGFLDALGEREALVLRGRCYERETVPCQAIDSLVDALTGELVVQPGEALSALLPPDVAVLARQFPALARVPAISRSAGLVPPGPDEQRRRALRAFAELVWLLAARRTPVIFVDDLQWSDADSTGALADVIRRLSAVGALVIASCRSAPDEAWRDALVRPAGAAPGTTRQTVRPGAPPIETRIELRELAVVAMPADDAARLVRAVLGEAPLAHRFAAAIAEESSGVPAFLVELARATSRRAPGDTEAGTEHEAPTPLSLEQLLEARLRELPADARALLEVCAVAARPLALDIAAAAAAAGGGEAAGSTGDPAAALSRLRVERLVRVAIHSAELRIEPYHDRIRAAVAAALSPDETRACHARLARALEGRPGTTAAERVTHWRAAGELARARELARDAAADAERLFAFHRAAELYALALEAEDLEAPARTALAQRRAECLATAGRLAEAIAVIAGAVDGADGPARRELKRLELECRLRRGDGVDGPGGVRALLAEVGVRIPAGRAATLAAFGASWIRRRVRGLDFTPRPVAEVPADALARIDMLWALATGLAYVSPTMGWLVQAQHLREALDAGEPSRVARALYVELPRLATSVDRPADLAPLNDRIRGLIADLDDPDVRARLRAGHEVTLCYASHLLGRWRDSATHAERAERLVRDHLHQRWLLCMVQFHRVAASWYLGEAAPIVEHMPRYLAEAEELGDAHTLDLLRISRSNVYWLVLDRVDEARAMANAARPPRERTEHFHTYDYLALQAHVQIDLYAGEGRAAIDRIERVWPAFQRSQLRWFRPLRIEALFLRARAAVAAAAVAEGPADRARWIALARRTARKLAAETLPWAHVLAAATEAAAAHAETGAEGPADRAKLAALLDRAADAAAAADMPLIAHAARHRRGAWCREPGLVEDATAVLRKQRFEDPAAIARTMIPG